MDTEKESGMSKSDFVVYEIENFSCDFITHF